MKNAHMVLGRVVLALLVLVLAGCRELRPEPRNKYRQYLSEASARGEFNGVALVFDGGDVVYQGVFGIRSIDPLASLNLNSQFRLASVSKQFTAMAIMQLMEDGKLRYDQDIRHFIPELPYEGITIRHLLQHVSGLPDYEPLMDQHWKAELKVDDPARYTDGNADVIRMLVATKTPVYFKPGERWRYSNTGYNLLGSIVARASGVSFAEFLRTRVFEPAGMSSTLLYDFVIGPDPHMPNRAYGYQVEWNGSDRSPADSHYLNHGQGEDGIYSTVGDLLKWDRILYTDKLVSKRTLQEAFTPAVLNNGQSTGYGFGWFIQRSPEGKRVVAHSGGWLAFSTHTFRAIDEDKFLVVLMNNAQGHFGAIAEGLTNLLYDRPATWPPRSIRREIGKAVAQSGAAHAVAQYKHFKAQRADEFRFAEDDLNILGYELLWAGRLADAVEIQRLNAQEYPDSANAHDSYGDALLAHGDRRGALESFRKAVALDASLTQTRNKIDAIESALDHSR